jgi:hypothetical protein
MDDAEAQAAAGMDDAEAKAKADAADAEDALNSAMK